MSVVCVFARDSRRFAASAGPRFFFGVLVSLLVSQQRGGSTGHGKAFPGVRLARAVLASFLAGYLLNHASNRCVVSSQAIAMWVALFRL